MVYSKVQYVVCEESFITYCIRVLIVFYSCDVIRVALDKPFTDLI